MPTFRDDLHLGHAVPMIDTDDINDHAITEEKIADNAVSTRTLQDGAVTEPKLADNAVSTRTIQDRAVTEPKIADGAVSTRTIADGAVTEPKLGDSAVSTRAFGDRAVTEPKLGDNSVSNRTIQNGAVNEPKLATDSVSTRTMQDKAVTEEKLAIGAVTSTIIKDKSITEPKLDDNAVSTRTIQNKSVTEPKLDDNAVSTRTIRNKAVNKYKIGDDVQGAIVLPITDQIDQKFTNITNELYNMIASLQVGGIALSSQFGDRTDIGINQKTLTKALGKFWEEMGKITGKDYMDFTFTVVPVATYSESPVQVTVTADCSESISDFDNIKIYVDDVLVAESSDLEVFTTQITIEKTSLIKAVGVIIGKTIEKEAEVIKEIPFFIGSAQEDYQDVMVPANWKEIDGSLQGDYDFTVNNNGEHIFVILPISRQEEFRRCRLDMNGFEIPFDITETSELIICKSQNTYNQGEYNIDIDINN